MKDFVLFQDGFDIVMAGDVFAGYAGGIHPVSKDISNPMHCFPVHFVALVLRKLGRTQKLIEEVRFALTNYGLVFFQDGCTQSGFKPLLAEGGFITGKFGCGKLKGFRNGIAGDFLGQV